MVVVRVVGRLGVCRAGRELSAREVGSRKARALLVLLATHRVPVPVDRIVGALWEESPPPRNPAASVATLISRLRATLGKRGILAGPGGYRLGDEVHVDLREAGQLTSRATSLLAARQPADALLAAGRAINLLDHGTVFAEEPEARWVEPARTLLDDLLRRARHAAADAALHVGEINTARVVAETAVAADLFDDTACRLLMRACYAAGEPARALIVYERLRSTLATEVGVDPTAATRDLHLAILRESATSAAS